MPVSPMEGRLMDAEVIKLLAALPLETVLIYLIVRQQAQIERLLASIIESEREHARSILELVTSKSCDRSVDK